jgi:hypothetical protein
VPGTPEITGALFDCACATHGTVAERANTIEPTAARREVRDPRTKDDETRFASARRPAMDEYTVRTPESCEQPNDAHAVSRERAMCLSREVLQSECAWGAFSSAHFTPVHIR